jgi:SSS family solute:Na+ symporter
MFGLPYWLALLIGLLVSTIYIYSGGLKGLVRADIIYFLVMYGGFVIMVTALVSQYGGLEFLRANVPGALFTPTGGQAFGAVFVWYIIASTTLIEPLYFELTYAAEKGSTALKGILISIAFWALFDFMTTTTGLYARALLKNLPDPAFAFPELARIVLPAGLFGLFLAALLATVMSTIDSYTFIAAQALGRDLVWRGMKHRDSIDTTRYVRIGLVATFIGAYVLALLSTSIIAVWHGLGSVAAPALLVPMLTSWSPRWKFPQKLVLAGMIIPATVALVWRLWPEWNGTEGYWLGVEPVYVGLSLSAVMYAAGRAWSR